MSRLKKHLFICTNVKSDGRECCGPKNGEQLINELKTFLQQKQLWDTHARVTRSGCLGGCTKGIAAVLYPEGRWFYNVTVNDLEKFKEILLEGAPQ